MGSKACLLVNNRLILIAFAFALGIACGNFGRTDPLVLILVGIVFLIEIFNLSYKQILILFSSFILGLTVSVLSAKSQAEIIENGKIELEDFKVKILSVESKGADRDSYIVKSRDDRIDLGDSYLNLKIYGKEQKFLPGDLISISKAKVYEISSFRNIGMFDYQKYREDNKIVAAVYPLRSARIDIVDSEFGISRFIEQIKNKMRDTLNFDDLQSTQTSQALILGDKGGISKELKEYYTKTGLAHILVVSGLHIGFITAFSYLLIRVLLFSALFRVREEFIDSGKGQLLAGFISILIALLYTKLVGAQIPALRSVIMVTIYFIALLMGRARNSYQAFAIAVILTLIIYPEAVFQASFLLSFTTVFFISVFILKYLAVEDDIRQNKFYFKDENLIYKFRHRFPYIAATIGIALIASVATFPLVIYYFNLIPSFGFILNIIVTPLSSILLPLGVASSISDLELPLYIFEKGVKLLNEIAKTFSQMEYGYINVAYIYPVSIFFYYLVMMLVLDLLSFRRKKLATVISTICLIVSILIPLIKDRIDNRLIVRFLDVGQGLSVIVKWKDGIFLVDGGPNYKTFNTGEAIIAKAIFNLGRRSLDAIFVSHPDSDHVGGLPDLYRRMKTKIVYSNDYPNDSEYFAGLIKMALKDGTNKQISRGDKVIFSDDIFIDILNPVRYNENENSKVKDNDTSVVMNFNYKGFKILFAADIDKKIEKDIIDNLDQEKIKADILVAAHHGSNTGSSTEFLEAVEPEYVVVVAGKNNRYNLPGRDFLNRVKWQNLDVMRTDIDGEIIMTFNDGKIRWRKFSDEYNK